MEADPHTPGTPSKPTAGDRLHITRAASVQFINPIVFRVIRCLDRPTYRGWVWLDGYQLNAAGDATARREIYVQLAGLEWLPEPPAPAGRRNQPPPRPRGGRRNQHQPSAPPTHISESLT